MKSPWSSTNRKGNVETFTGLDGRPTTRRPHVHTIFDERTGDVRLVATSRTGAHPFRATLRRPSGNEVNEAQQRLRRQLARYERRSPDDRLR